MRISDWSSDVCSSDLLFGLPVADPYRWLETDVRDSDRVRAWVEAENAVTDAYLDTLPGRAAFTARMRTLFDYERFGVPVKKGGRYFYLHNSGLQNQPVLYVREPADGQGRVPIGRAAVRESGGQTG